MRENFYGIIMAGGVGSRFWPMSTAAHPKQFIDILGTGKSLIQQTYNRLSGICRPENIFVVTNERYRKLCVEQLPEIPSENILCEPSRRNTAPCIAYASEKISKLNSKAAMVVMPSDHLITDEINFVRTITEGMTYASGKNVLLTIGIKPSRPDTGYGYIHFDKLGKGYIKVKSFTEKPDLEKAKEFLKSGDYSWNSGMFIWSASSIGEAFRKHLPAMKDIFESGAEKYNTPGEQDFINSVYNSCENISVDYGIMERASNVEVVNADFGWSDLGTWGSLYEHLDKDTDQNAAVGEDVMCFESGGNIIHTSKGKLVVIQGLKDFIVVEHENALLICRKQDEQNIKKIVEKIEREKGTEWV